MYCPEAAVTVVDIVVADSVVIQFKRKIYTPVAHTAILLFVCPRKPTHIYQVKGLKWNSTCQAVTNFLVDFLKNIVNMVNNYANSLPAVCGLLFSCNGRTTVLVTNWKLERNFCNLMQLVYLFSANDVYILRMRAPHGINPRT